MRKSNAKFFWIVPVLFLLQVSCGKPAIAQSRKPVPVTICSIGSKPLSYDNKLVAISGEVSVSWEYSLLIDDKCSPIWFVLEPAEPAPGLLVYVTPPTRALPAHRIPIKLNKDAAYQSLVDWLKRSQKGEACLQDPTPKDELPDCRTYRITATFIGRIDAVKSSDKHRGFGHMGMFGSQLIVQQVENVSAHEIEFPAPESSHK
jgi:hypothetical protein